MKNLRNLPLALMAALAGVSGTAAQAAGSVSVIHAFQTTVEGSSGSVSDGAMPKAALTLGKDGYLYGTAYSGGTTFSGDVSTNGTIFKVKPNGSGFATVYTFSTNDSKDGGGRNSDGANPSGALIQGTDGNFYGTAQNGGAHSAGTVFKVTSSGRFTTLYSFAVTQINSQGNRVNTDGANPHATLTDGGDGYFYSTTFQGGANGAGTVFRIKGDGTGFKTLHVFSAGDANNHNTDGAILESGLTLGGDGLLYGTAIGGGATGSGTIYRLARDGTGFTVIHTFPAAVSGVNTGGALPAAGLTAGTDGFFYGVTYSGGAHATGTIFKITPDGKTFQSLYSFSAADANADNKDGAGPLGTLARGVDGSFYGTASVGGANGGGTLFQINSNGSGFAVLHSFSALDDNGNNAEGSDSVAGLTLGTDGSFYGTASGGGLNGTGTLFHLVLSPPARVRLLWRNTNGVAALWTVNADGSFASQQYGPYAGWTARAVSDGPDGVTHLLWTNTNGTAALWNVPASGAFTVHQYGPFTGYASVSLSTGSDNVSHLLWNRSDGQASLWAVNTTTGAYTHGEVGPYAHWTANAVASGKTVTDLLWTNTNGQMDGYRYAANGTLTTQVFGPYSGWAAKALSVGPDDVSHPLWDNTSGETALWSAGFTGGSFTAISYGPYSGWTARAVATGPDNVSHLLWNHAPDNQAALWSVTGSGFTAKQYGPYAGWQAVAVSAGP